MGARQSLASRWAAALLVASAGVLAASSCQRSRENTEALEAAADLRDSEAAYRNVDPALVKYSQGQEIETGLAESVGIAVAASGVVYIVGDEELRVFSDQGTLLQRTALVEEPHCVAVDEAGAIVIGYRETVRIHAPDGAVQAAWAVAGKHPYLTCVTPSGPDVWVADAGDRVVLRYDRSGRLLGRLGEKDEAKGIPGLVVPSYHLDVALGPEGLLMVNNPGRLGLETYTAQGELCSSWEKASMEIEGFCGCCNPTDIAVLPDGRVVTSEKGLPRVKVLESDGALSGVVATPDDLSPTAAGLDLAVDAAGRVYVLDAPAGVVRVFALKRPAPAGESDS